MSASNVSTPVCNGSTHEYLNDSAGIEIREQDNPGEDVSTLMRQMWYWGDFPARRACM